MNILKQEALSFLAGNIVTTFNLGDHGAVTKMMQDIMDRNNEKIAYKELLAFCSGYIDEVLESEQKDEKIKALCIAIDNWRYNYDYEVGKEIINDLISVNKGLSEINDYRYISVLSPNNHRWWIYNEVLDIYILPDTRDENEVNELIKKHDLILIDKDSWYTDIDTWTPYIKTNVVPGLISIKL